MTRCPFMLQVDSGKETKMGWSSEAYVRTFRCKLEEGHKDKHIVD